VLKPAQLHQNKHLKIKIFFIPSKRTYCFENCRFLLPAASPTICTECCWIERRPFWCDNFSYIPVLLVAEPSHSRGSVRSFSNAIQFLTAVADGSYLLRCYVLSIGPSYGQSAVPCALHIRTEAVQQNLGLFHFEEGIPAAVLSTKRHGVKSHNI